ncbi:MAG: hypothetical protein LH606_10010 [Cytophagaceae bacterium]|nr:hypothetical protein [Cytophagaceae bacterium]
MPDAQTFDVISGKRFNRFELADRGDLVFFPYLRPCRVKILMVVDASISFSHSYFGLSHVLDVLRNNPEFYVKFDVTRAHRNTDNFKPNQATDPIAWSRYGPHFEGFRFTQPNFNLNDFDQVWFYGFYGEGHPTGLNDAELELLSRWMDNGGGVFATGDHFNLGAALCSRIPRVRSMRKWTAAQGVPPANSPIRHDTLLKGSNANYTFDDESDDQPMRITPKRYLLSSWSPFLRRSRPHPVLCGQDGVIDILPDHPHEGEVLDTSEINLTGKFGFGSYLNQDEYPNSGAAAPERIARAFIQGDHQPTDFKGSVNAKSFGVIGAYDGHQADDANQKPGRVVVDSTWHHWFDVNLIGRPITNLDSFPMNGTNPKTQGFLATPAGLQALSRIDNYFRNVAVWLSPKTKQRCMLKRATWGIVLRYPLIERLDPKMPIWELGGTAYDALGQRAGQCIMSGWLLEVLPRDLLKIFDVPPFPEPNPCLTCPPFELIERYVLGGITRELLELGYKMDDGAVDEKREMDERSVTEAFNQGAARGIGEVLKGLESSLQSTRKQHKILSDVLPKLTQI